MKKVFFIAFALLNIGGAQHAPTHYLLTFQLAPGLDLTHLTPEHLAAFRSKGLMMGGRTDETAGTLAIIILATDAATAQAAIADDPATKAGYLKAAVHPFSLLMPPAALVSETK